MDAMNKTMKYLCENIQGCVLGYTQSDEISLLLVDYQTLTTDSWFDDTVQKMCSISASMATLAFNKAWKDTVNEWAASKVEDWDYADDSEKNQLCLYVSKYDRALFDSRVFNVPKEDVANYFVWRQQDATRNFQQLHHNNSLQTGEQGTGQTHQDYYSHPLHSEACQGKCDQCRYEH